MNGSIEEKLKEEEGNQKEIEEIVSRRIEKDFENELVSAASLARIVQMIEAVPQAKRQKVAQCSGTSSCNDKVEPYLSQKNKIREGLGGSVTGDIERMMQIKRELGVSTLSGGQHANIAAEDGHNNHLSTFSSSNDQSQWNDMSKILQKNTSFGNESSKLALGRFEPGEETVEFLREDCKVLVIGAGGLGCEILKDLAMSGFVNIHVIDMDTIDVSNLNRQFLFRSKDIGMPKANVAATFINDRVEGVNVVPHHGKIQDFDTDFYREFNVIISGLDNIEARRWLNSAIISMVEVDENGNPDPETIIPLIDGGTEGFKGQGRVIIPMITSCFECSLDAFPPQKAFPMCTIAETPRLPEHCIAYAYMILWEKSFPDKKLDTDSPDDMQWVYKQAADRAKQYGIAGVTYTNTIGVVKNIIPAVASTNAAIAAICVNEVVKVMSYCSQTMNNYHMHMGATGVYSHTFEYEKKLDCAVCSKELKSMTVSSSTTLQELIDSLREHPSYRLKKPSISTGNTNLFMQGPPALRKATEPNLKKLLAQLMHPNEQLIITDPVFVGDMALALTIQFEA